MKLVTLGEIFKITSGGTPSRDIPDYYSNGSIPWIKTGDLKQKYIEESSEYITELAVKKSSAKLFPIGTVLIAMYGATIGATSILNIDATTNQACAALLPNDKMLPEYLYYFFIANKKNIVNMGVGGAQPNISGTILKGINISLENLDRQREVVNTLDKAQSLIDKRNLQLEGLDELIQSVFYDMFGDPIINNKKIRTCKLEEIGDWKSGGTPSRSNTEYFKGDIHWLSSGELNNMYCYDSLEKITEEAINNSGAKMIEVGSLLLGMYDTAALKSTINLMPCACNQAIVYSKLNNKMVNTKFVYYCIQLSKDFYKSQQRGVRQKNLNLSMVKDIKVLFPTLKEQEKFALLFDNINNKKELLQKSLTQLENNFNVIIQRAFKGELFN